MENTPLKKPIDNEGKWYQIVQRNLKALLNYFFGKKESNTGINMNYLFKRGIISLIGLTIIICLFFLNDECNGGQVAILNFLLLSSASLAGGSAIGFLFGLPRSTKYKVFKSEDGSINNNADSAYSDNTNLEEVSDWLTKIIVGLSLVKFQTILFWIDKAAHNFEKVVQLSCNDFLINEYLLGYCTIIFYFLCGGGLVYIWSRVNLHVIFTDSRLALAERGKAIAEKEKQLAEQQAEQDRRQAEEENRKLEEKNKMLVSQTQELAIEKFQKEQEIVETGINQGERGKEDETAEIADFKLEVEKLYAAKGTPIDREDLQKGRWGGSFSAAGFVFDAYEDPRKSFFGLVTVVLRVKNIDGSRNWNGRVAFFLHDTFPNQIVYAKAKDGIAEYKTVAYEAFVAGARTDTGAELELDLNKVPGFPSSFYYP